MLCSLTLNLAPGLKDSFLLYLHLPVGGSKPFALVCFKYCCFETVGGRARTALEDILIAGEKCCLIPGDLRKT